MKILIVGGAGYIGGVTTHLAKQAGHEVVVADDFSSGKRHNVPENIQIVTVDIRNRDDVAKLFTDSSYDAVMHFAAKILVGESMEKPYDYFDVNTVGALNVVDQAVKHGVKNYIFSSSAAAYGEPTHTPLTENDPTQPVNPYGTSKLLTEYILQSYQTTHNLQWVALRYFNVVGAFDGVGTDYPFVSHIVPMLLDRMHHKEPFIINGTDYDTPDGTCIRDYTHVVDIARAHLLAAEAMANNTPLNQPINLGSHTGYSVKQVCDTFNKVTSADIPVEFGPKRPGDPARLVAGNQRAKELLDWEPQHNLEAMIQDHFDWYKQAKLTGNK